MSGTWVCVHCRTEDEVLGFCKACGRWMQGPGPGRFAVALLALLLP
ncbi:hypothetical protein FNQ90_05255 [Streptomyces alkaliphilus]|uniref:Uncharacterized protein n=1 Tax=Streptomyces alkaliphilus TaxID=1472722 RepID=A0A7W3TAZ5_9ACTN|nr:hypothetical protein [Streptomyces alkaliphilus]MBB0243529.1 hypothetical protein [Streptomyces alkaliphilus]